MEGEILCGRADRGLKWRLIKSTCKCCVAESVWMQFACLSGTAQRVASPGDKPHCLDLTVKPSSAWAEFCFALVAALCFGLVCVGISMCGGCLRDTSTGQELLCSAGRWEGSSWNSCSWDCPSASLLSWQAVCGHLLFTSARAELAHCTGAWQWEITLGWLIRIVMNCNYLCSPGCNQ